MTRSQPLWEVFVDYGSRSRHASKFVFAPTAERALKKTKRGKSVRLVGDGLNRKLFPHLFEDETTPGASRGKSVTRFRPARPARRPVR